VRCAAGVDRDVGAVLGGDVGPGCVAEELGLRGGRFVGVEFSEGRRVEFELDAFEPVAGVGSRGPAARSVWRGRCHGSDSRRIGPDFRYFFACFESAKNRGYLEGRSGPRPGPVKMIMPGLMVPLVGS